MLLTLQIALLADYLFSYHLYSLRTHKVLYLPCQMQICSNASRYIQERSSLVPNDVTSIKSKKLLDFRLFGLMQCCFLSGICCFWQVDCLGWFPLVVCPWPCFVHMQRRNGNRNSQKMPVENNAMSLLYANSYLSQCFNLFSKTHI